MIKWLKMPVKSRKAARKKKIVAKFAQIDIWCENNISNPIEMQKFYKLHLKWSNQTSLWIVYKEFLFVGSSLVFE